MAGVTSSTVGLTFTNYLQEVSETLNHQSKGRLLCRQKKNWTGSHLEWRVHTQRTSAVGFVDDGGQFPVADKQDYVAAKAYRRMIVGKIQLTDGVMAAAKRSRNVARDVISSETKGLMRDILKEENFHFFRDGTGKVAGCPAVSTASATTITVDDGRGLWEGSTYDLLTSSGAVKQAGLGAVSLVDSALTSSNVTFDVATAYGTSTATTDYFVRAGATSSKTITGLESLIDDTAATFQAVPVGTYPRYAALVMGNSGGARELTPSLFRQMLAGLKQKSGNDNPSKGITVLASNWDAISVEELYEGDIRLSPSDKVAGLAVQSFQSFLGRVDIVTDPDMLLGKMFFADFSQIHRGVQKPLAWRRDGRGSIFKRSDVSGVYTATALEICEHFIKERHTSGRLDDLSYSRSTAY